MATLCPLCKKSNLKKRGDVMVLCEGYKPKKEDSGEWTNEGDCEFHIGFKNKVFGSINASQVKDMVEGKTISNSKGDKMVLDLESNFYTSITFAEKKEDEDL